jgi:hypothetical protein
MNLIPIYQCRSQVFEFCQIFKRLISCPYKKLTDKINKCSPNLNTKGPTFDPCRHHYSVSVMTPSHLKTGVQRTHETLCISNKSQKYLSVPMGQNAGWAYWRGYNPCPCRELNESRQNRS